MIRPVFYHALKIHPVVSSGLDSPETIITKTFAAIVRSNSALCWPKMAPHIRQNLGAIIKETRLNLQILFDCAASAKTGLSDTDPGTTLYIRGVGQQPNLDILFESAKHHRELYYIVQISITSIKKQKHLQLHHHPLKVINH